MPFVDDGISSPPANRVSVTDATPSLAGGPRTLTSIPDVLRVNIGLPTADPHQAGALWLNNGILTTSAG